MLALDFLSRAKDIWSMSSSALLCLPDTSSQLTSRQKTRAQLALWKDTNVKLVEPPSCSSAALPLVFIGRNHRGHWVAQEQNGRYGGLFVNRDQAIKYALTENGHHSETIIELSRKIELDMGGDLVSERSRRLA